MSPVILVSTDHVVYKLELIFKNLSCLLTRTYRAILWPRVENTSSWIGLGHIITWHRRIFNSPAAYISGPRSAFRSEDLCGPFVQFVPIKDIYLPRDYDNGEPLGFAFVRYVDPADAADAKHYLDGEILRSWELMVVFAEENRKKPSEMRARGRIRGRSYDRTRSPLRYSCSPCYGRSYSRSPSYYSPPPRRRNRGCRERSYSRSLYDLRSWSRSPRRSMSK